MAINTKDQIADCFSEMAKKKSVDKITVTELVEKCNISRQSFYYHFQDIIDLMEYRVSQKMDYMLTAASKETSHKKAVEIFVNVITEQYNAVKTILRSQHREEFERMLINGIKTYLYNLFSPMKKSAFDNDAVLHFYACGMMGLLLEYGDSRSSDELSELIIKFISNLEI